MYPRAKAVLLLSLVLLRFWTANSDREFYKNILINERVIEKLILLSPDLLLENYQTNQENFYIINETCSSDIDAYNQAINQNELWALEMSDASSNVPSGILQGNLLDFGVYDECLKVKGQSAGRAEIRGRYCTYSFEVECNNCMIPLIPQLSICLPNTCTSEDVVKLVKTKVSASNDTNILDDLSISADCIHEEEEFPDRKLVVFIYLLGTYLGFLVACTVYDVLQRRHASKDEDSGPVGVLERFSLLRNAKKILRTSAEKDNLSFVNGLRFLSSLSIVFLHAYFLQAVTVSADIFYIVEWMASWRAPIPILCNFSIDTFFTLSGFFTARSFSKRVQEKNENVFRFFLRRYIRLTLPMILICGSGLIIYPVLGSGPRWQWFLDIFMDGCYSKWWSFFFEIHNFVETENYCMLHVWTNAVDIQLFTISLFMLLLLYKNKKLGMIALISCVWISIISTAIIMGINRYPATLFSNRSTVKIMMSEFNDVYMMTYTRATPYFLGVLLGYKVNNGLLKLDKVTTYIGWIFVVFIFAAMIIIMKIMLNENFEYIVIIESLASAFSRPIWSVAICWIIYAHMCGSAGPLSRFLSWKYFVPLSRLTYCLYLSHVLFPVYDIMTSRNSVPFSDYTVLHSFIGNLGLSIILAFICCLVFEMPVFAIEDLIFEKPLKSSSKTQSSNAKES